MSRDMEKLVDYWDADDHRAEDFSELAELNEEMLCDVPDELSPEEVGAASASFAAATSSSYD
eukprot:1198826-Heterocapsa_arctica.AAC.1